METITQPNKTLLFAEINPERLNLLTLIGDVRGKSSLDGDKIKEINEELVVSSFEDFLDKFSPVVYSWCDAASSSIQYSLKSRKIFEQASQNYNHVLVMLPLAIEDIKTRLLHWGRDHIQFKWLRFI